MHSPKKVLYSDCPTSGLSYELGSDETAFRGRLFMRRVERLLPWQAPS
jgi:hypothetical protein